MIHYRILLFLILSLASISLSAQQTSHVTQIDNSQKIDYLLYLPKDYEQNAGETFPLLLFLHGGGEGGDNIEKVKTHGPPKLVAQGQDFPFLILSPQNPETRKFWDSRMLIELLDEIVKEYRIDTSRIYLTGMSRGGYGTWTLAMQYPERFAALAPVCGAAPASYAVWVPDVPIWVFHGVNDPLIDVSESVNIVKKLKELKKDVKLTIYEETGHNAWEQAYADPQLYEWLMKQTLRQADKK